MLRWPNHQFSLFTAYKIDSGAEADWLQLEALWKSIVPSYWVISLISFFQGTWKQYTSLTTIWYWCMSQRFLTLKEIVSDSWHITVSVDFPFVSCAIRFYSGHLLSGMMYLTSSAWEDALQKEKGKVKELEEKYHTKILENGVRPQSGFACHICVICVECWCGLAHTKHDRK